MSGILGREWIKGKTVRYGVLPQPGTRRGGEEEKSSLGSKARSKLWAAECAVEPEFTGRK